MRREDRFWAKVDKSGVCWSWTGAVMGRGYGKFWDGSRLVGAHRVAWEIANGSPVPAGMFVCHRCDNPLCVRPSHLFLGTHIQNMQDATSKGRMNLGGSHGLAKLDERSVSAIRSAALAGESHSTIARRHGVERSTVSRIVRREAWRHVA